MWGNKDPHLLRKLIAPRKSVLGSEAFKHGMCGVRRTALAVVGWYRGVADGEPELPGHCRLKGAKPGARLRSARYGLLWRSELRQID